MYVAENIGNRRKNKHDGQKDFPGSGIIFPVRRPVLFISPNQRNSKNRHEKNNKCNLSFRKMHGVKVIRKSGRNGSSQNPQVCFGITLYKNLP
jgi:hypothetical protein